MLYDFILLMTNKSFFVSLMNDAWLKYIKWRYMTHIYDCVCRMTYASGQVSRVQHDASTWDATHSYGIWLVHTRHDSYHMCIMTHSHGMRRIHMGYDLIIHDMTQPWHAWLKSQNEYHMCNMIHSHGMWRIHMGYDLFIRDMTHTTWNMTHSYRMRRIHMGCDAFIWDMTCAYETWLILRV